MAERRPACFAYAVVQVERQQLDDSIDISHAPAPPQIGQIAVYEERQGADSLIVEQSEAGVPIRDIVHLHLVGTGRMTADGPEFDYETSRVFALIQIGANAERVLHQQIDKVFERFEEVAGNTFHLEPEHLERLRKEFP